MCWDTFFRHVSGKWEWTPLYLLILWLIYRRTGWRGMALALVFMVAGVVAGDHIATFFKTVLPRLRPSHTPGLQAMVHTVNGYVGGLYGTVSAHTATSFCIAVFSSLAIRSRLFTVPILLWALSVAYSRVYLGVHFPLDLLYGAITGAAIGYVAYLWWRAIYKKMKR
jgi:undecaprenyl-diphosphatase